MNLVDLQTFVHVAELGTLAAASQTLGIPKSTISRRIKRLEDELGVALVLRGGHRYRLTDEGGILHHRCSPALREIADVEATLGDFRVGPSGLLRITAPNDVAVSTQFAVLIEKYHRRYPGVHVEIQLTNRVVDLIEEGFDVALRPGPVRGPESGLMSRSLGASGMGLYAGTAYLAARGTPVSPEQLAEHRWILHTMMRQHSRRPESLAPWLPETANIYVSAHTVMCKLAVAGCGIALLPNVVATPDVEAGHLRALLPGLLKRTGRMRLVWPVTRYLSPRVRAFIDIAAEEMGPPSAVKPTGTGSTPP